MKTRAVRLYGVNDLRVEEFELPPIKEDEILAKVITNSICMSDHKAAEQGASHKRVPDDVATNPIILGHEFCGEIVEVGKKWAGKFKSGSRFSIQPALNYQGTLDAPGYSFRYIGGDATYIVIPHQVMELDCLLPYEGDAFFLGSLAEPVSCIVGTFHAMYHTNAGSYVHEMGIVEGGNLAIIAGVGPMGLGSIDYALHAERKPGLLVVTDIDDARLARASQLYSPQEAAKNGVKLVYLNTKNIADPVSALKDLTGGKGYDDVMVMAPVRPLVEQADAILAQDGCLNFFAGPNKSDFKAELNFYDVHYSSHHIVGTSGGNTDDMRESLAKMEKGILNPAVMVTHIGGLDAVPQSVINLPSIPGGKKLMYTHLHLPLVAIADFAEVGKTDPLYAELDRLVKKHNGLWSTEAEKYLLSQCKED
ncbi:theronine dehydrogenase-like Zn-dependent dehydrogenase [Sphaerochaeta pleomorpha str. Grapes]|uniref:Theronine dehydrogenase-like Zn-dependent dehydrogenase n=1 Tax=Sphaerochaeta pleomorpha (strain ATCC BAA-1885 / DSM 22778 / Grapes) TaxID=158190 RepID=G8QUP6_SPHPG|nr:zinc-binding dehydrogenase [Sphaerochaeta pleomorpha]AEV30354.1 theronine dehydrogenase-like Zn-dependent dehydrogenase [Sphaerochaeta pleomorpha str. Grapes]